MSATELIFPWNDVLFDREVFYNTYYLDYSTLSSLSEVL